MKFGDPSGAGVFRQHIPYHIPKVAKDQGLGVSVHFWNEHQVREHDTEEVEHPGQAV